MKKIIKHIAVALIFTAAQNMSAQNEGVSIKSSPSAPHPSAMLDIESGSKGLLIPRVVLQATINPSPVSSPTTGLLVFNKEATNLPVGFYYWDAIQSPARWVKVATGANAITPPWTIDPNNTTSTYRRGGFVTVGAPSSGGSGAYAGSTTTLNVFGTALFFADNNSGSTVVPNGSEGIAIGEPFNNTGGHWNEINTHGHSYLDLQYGPNGGDVIIGGGWGGGGKLKVCKSSANTKGDIEAEGTLYAQNSWSSSDSTLKRDITALPTVGSKLDGIQTYKYRYKDENSSVALQIGVMAQELETNFPELVKTVTSTNIVGNKFSAEPQTVTKTYKTVNYQGLTAVLLKALKEQQAEIELLKGRVLTLEGR